MTDHIRDYIFPRQRLSTNTVNEKIELRQTTIIITYEDKYVKFTLHIIEKFLPIGHIQRGRFKNC